MFLFHLITGSKNIREFNILAGSHCCFQSLLLLWDYLSRHIVALFETSVLKEVRILRYLHNISAVLIPKFQNKAIVYFTW